MELRWREGMTWSDGFGREDGGNGWVVVDVELPIVIWLFELDDGI